MLLTDIDAMTHAALAVQTALAVKSVVYLCECVHIHSFSTSKTNYYWS